MTPANIILSIVVSAGLIILIFELVRRKKLNEEYSWLWMTTAVVLLLLSLFPGLLLALTHLLGIRVPINTLFFFGLIFLILIVLHFSTIISRLANRQKALAQKVALLEFELAKKQDK